MVEQSTMPLEAAVRLAIAGNIIDWGPSSEIDQSGIDEAIGSAWSGRLDSILQAAGELKIKGQSNDHPLIHRVSCSLAMLQPV